MQILKGEGKSRIAILGCIGSGKTALSQIWSKFHPVENADRIAEEVMYEKRAELAARYGEDIVEEGRLNKKRLSEILFDGKNGDSDEERRWIAELIHEDVTDLIFERLNREFGFAEITAPSIPLVMRFDGLVVVEVSEDEAVLRTESRASAWSEERRRRIFRQQRDRIEACVRAFGEDSVRCGFVFRLDNSGSEEELFVLSKLLLTEIKKKFKGGA